MKKVFKLGILLIVLGVCLFYTYQFVNYNLKLDKKDKIVSENGEAEKFQTASPEKIQNLDVGWERVRYSFIPSLQDLMWTEVNTDYIIEVENVSYRVTAASIQKEWKSGWNYDAVKDDYDFKDNKQIKGKKSFVSASMVLKNIGQKDCKCSLNCMSLHIYNEDGEKIMSSGVATASLDKPYTKSFYFEKLKSNETIKVDLVYIIQDKYLKDNYYYFIDAIPWNTNPTSKEQVGIFKLPLGIEEK